MSYKCVCSCRTPRSTFDHLKSEPYRGTSLIRKRTLLGPYRSLCLGSYGSPRGLSFSYGRGTFVTLDGGGMQMRISSHVNDTFLLILLPEPRTLMVEMLDVDVVGDTAEWQIQLQLVLIRQLLLIQLLKTLHRGCGCT